MVYSLRIHRDRNEFVKPLTKLIILHGKKLCAGAVSGLQADEAESYSTSCIENTFFFVFSENTKNIALSRICPAGAVW